MQNNFIKHWIAGHQANEIKYDFPFTLLCVLALWGGLKPEFIIPGLKSIGVVRQIPSLLNGLLFMLWIAQGSKIFHNRQTKLYLAYFGLLVLGTFFARNPYRAFLVTKGTVLTVMVVISMIGFVDSYAKLRKLIDIWLWSNLYIVFLGIKGGGMVRGIPALSDENDFALLMNMLIPFAFFQTLAENNKKKKIIYLLMTITFAFGVIISFSRGGFVGLVCVLAYCLSKVKKKLKIIVAIFFLFLCVLPFVPQKYWKEIETLKQGTEESTAEKRIYLWTNALKIFSDHPIIGVGADNSGVWMTTYDSSERGERDWGRALHSIYLTLLSEQGLVGVCLFFLIIHANFKDLRFLRASYFHASDKSLLSVQGAAGAGNKGVKNRYYMGLAIAAGLIGYLSSGAFLSVLYYGWFEKLMTYMIILRNSAETAKRS